MAATSLRVSMGVSPFAPFFAMSLSITQALNHVNRQTPNHLIRITPSPFCGIFGKAETQLQHCFCGSFYPFNECVVRSCQNIFYLVERVGYGQ